MIEKCPDFRNGLQILATRRLRRERYAEIAVTAIVGGGAAGWALISLRPIAATLAIGVWLFIAIAWLTSIRLRRDILAPSADTATAFLDLSIRRGRRRLQGLVAQGLLFVAILAFDLVWIYHYQAETQPMGPWAFLTSGTMLVMWAVPVALGVRYRRRFRHELQNLLSLQRQLDEKDFLSIRRDRIRGRSMRRSRLIASLLTVGPAHRVNKTLQADSASEL
jgi:hypothetical protein